MAKLLHALVGAVLGTVAGILGAIAHAGPVDQPIVGMIVASLLVASGAWLALELGRALGWCGYAVALFVVTIWLLFFPPANDVVVSPSGWASEIWGIVAVLAAWVPLLVTSRQRKDRRKSSRDV